LEFMSKKHTKRRSRAILELERKWAQGSWLSTFKLLPNCSSLTWFEDETEKIIAYNYKTAFCHTSYWSVTNSARSRPEAKVKVPRKDRTERR
jgi:hypothetical protein